MKVKYLGHSCFYLESGNFKALIDPFINGNPKAKITADELGPITHIFITHGHSDHMGDVLEIATKNNSMVIVNFEIANYLGKWRINTHPMHLGGRVKLNFGTVKMTPALHGSGIMDSESKEMVYGGNPCGFVIEVDGVKVYHAGDTGLTMDMKLLERENIDLCMLPIGGNFTMDIEDAVLATTFIKAKKVVPMHYGTFPIIEADPKEFCAKVKDGVGIAMEINSEIEI